MRAQGTCALRRATEVDAVAVDQFLARCAASSIFLRSNLEQHGAENNDAPYGMRLFVSGSAEITGVYAVTNGGYLLAQAADATKPDWIDFRREIAGTVVKGFTGVPAQVQAGVDALGLADGPWAIAQDEPLYHLDLEDLRDVPGDVRAPQPKDRETLARWFAGYFADTGLAAETEAQAYDRADWAIGHPSEVTLLEREGAPVAMAAINARVRDIVQIGGVYTPCQARGRGFARAALAGLLRNERSRGVAASVLFANNRAAARAYEALGYRRVGQTRVMMLKTPQEIRP